MSQTKNGLGRMLRYFHKSEAADRDMLEGSDYARGLSFGERWAGTPAAESEGRPVPREGNPLWDYFCEHNEGPGIWKWDSLLRYLPSTLCKVSKPVVQHGGGRNLQRWQSGNVEFVFR